MMGAARGGRQRLCTGERPAAEVQRMASWQHARKTGQRAVYTCGTCNCRRMWEVQLQGHGKLTC